MSRGRDAFWRRVYRAAFGKTEQPREVRPHKFVLNKALSAYELRGVVEGATSRIIDPRICAVCVNPECISYEFPELRNLSSHIDTGPGDTYDLEDLVLCPYCGHDYGDNIWPKASWVEGEPGRRITAVRVLFGLDARKRRLSCLSEVSFKEGVGAGNTYCVQIPRNGSDHLYLDYAENILGCLEMGRIPVPKFGYIQDIPVARPMIVHLDSSREEFSAKMKEIERAFPSTEREENPHGLQPCLPGREADQEAHSEGGKRPQMSVHAGSESGGQQ